MPLSQAHFKVEPVPLKTLRDANPKYFFVESGPPSAIVSFEIDNAIAGLNFFSETPLRHDNYAHIRATDALITEGHSVASHAMSGPWYRYRYPEASEDLYRSN